MADEAAAGSSPAGIVGSGAALLALLGVLGYFPALVPRVQFQLPWLSMAFALTGSVLTFVAWRERCRGRVGEVATLLDNVFYSAALTFAAVNVQPAYGYALAVIHGLMLIAMPAQVYALTLVLAAALAAPLLLSLALFQPSLRVAIVLVASYVLAMLASHFTKLRRQMAREKAKLREAVGAADRVAEESLQAALAATLLSLGNFLHELRNQQTVVVTNLQYLLEKTDPKDPMREMLTEALEAQHRERELVVSTMDALRSRARPANTVFLLREVVEHLASDTKGLRVTVTSGPERFLVDGPAEYLRIVLGNLLRNADNAGASALFIDLRAEGSGQEVRITVRDDGPGLPAASRASVFQPFAESTSPDGTGLGLYLCRRYVELLGGTISLEAPRPSEGATFVVRLPCRVTPANESAPANAQTG